MPNNKRKKKGEDWDLSKAEIYKIVNLLDLSNCYVGSTTIGLDERFYYHKRDVNNNTNTSPFHLYMNDIGLENFDIIHIEYPKVKTWQELELRELEIADELKKEGYIIWNTFTSKEEETKRLTEIAKKFWDGNQEAKKNARDRFFKYGCISRNSSGNKHFWYFSCTVNRKQHSKKFSVNKMGEEQAELAARNYRYEYFKITPEEYEDWLSRQNFNEEKIKKIEEKIKKEKEKYREYFSRTGGKHHSFNYGTIFKSGNSWTFQWQENGKKKSKSFSINKYGYNEARQKAEEVRIQTYPELKNININSD